MKPRDEMTGDRTPRPGAEEAAQFGHADQPGDVPAWEEVDVGRYMPRRIKGSCKGRALG